MKKVFKKLGITLIIIITALMMLKSTFSPYVVFAETAAEEEASKLEAMDIVGDVGDFLLGLVLYIPKAMGMALASLLRLLVWGITAIGGEGSGDGVGSVDAIIFGKASITSIDFFNTSGNETINAIRQNVAIWYYVLRNLSIVILLGILLYVGIRMAISTVASDQAKYKKMFMDWAVSLALVFVLQYIMIFTIECNNVLVDILDTARVGIQRGTYADGLNGTFQAGNDALGIDPEDNQYDNALDQIASQAWHVSFTVGVSSTLVYIILVGITIIFLIMYIKRMLTIGFLIVISPLITITYSIDKMGDGKSQALNAWLKEFVFNVLIQPFHCIIYLIFTSTAVNLLVEQQTLASAVLSICMILFIFKGEKIVRDIFNFRASSLGEAIGGAAAITTGISMLKNKGEKDKKNKVDTKKMPNMNNPGDKTGGAGPGAGVKPGSEVGKGSGTEKENGTSTSTGGEQNGFRQLSEPKPKTPEFLPYKTLEPQGSKFGKVVKAIASAPLHPIKSIKGATGMAFGGAEKLYGKLSPGIRQSLASSAKIATVATMAALGASTGSGKGIMAGMYAGRSMTEGAGAIASSRKANNLVAQNEEKFAQAYQNYKAENPGLTDQQIAMQTQYMLEHGDPDKMTESEREYYSYARQMQQTYGVIGEEKVEDRMQETLGLIASGQIQPPKPEQPKPQKPQKQSKKRRKSK